MANRIKGITIEIGGDTTGLDKALKGVNSTIRETQSSLRDVNRLLKLDPSNTKLLAQKQQLLQGAISETSDKLNALKEADKQAKVQLENGTLGQEKYDALQREIIETESNLNDLKEKAKEVDNISLAKLENEFDKTGKKIETLGKGMSNLGQFLSTRVTLPLTAVGTVGFNMAADLQDALGATEQIYGKQAREMENWSSQLKSYYGISQNEALSYSNTMGAMLKNIGGLSDQEAAKTSQKLVELAGDLSAMFGGTTESAVLALTGALKGNNAMLDNYGMGVSDATIKAKAFEMGLYDGKGALGLQAKQAATLALIMEQTADAQGQAGREAQGASGSMKILKTELKNAATTIGSVLLPMITPLIQKISSWVSRFKELSPEMQKTVVVIGLIVAAVGPMLMVLGTLVGKVGVAMQGFSKLIGVFSKFTSGVTGITGLFGKLGAAIGAISAPVMVVVGIIAVLVSAFMTLWNTNEDFRNSIITTWNAIKDTISAFIENIQQRFSELGINFSVIIETLKGIWEGFCNLLAPIFEGAFQAISVVLDTVCGVIIGILDVFIGLFTGNWEQVWEGVKMLFQSIWDGIKGILETVLDMLLGIVDAFLSWLGTNWENIWNGVKNFFVNTWEAIKTTAGNVVEGIKSTISGVFQALKSTVESIWNGIKSAITTPIEAAKNFVKSAIDKIKSFFNFKWSLPKIKLPHFSIKGSFSLVPPKIPRLSVDWYKKAMNKPMLLNGATIFGSKGGHLLGGGEKGPEVIMGLDALQNMTAGANRDILSVMTNVLAMMNAYFPKFSETNIVLDTGEFVGGIAPQMDMALGKLQRKKERGW